MSSLAPDQKVQQRHEAAMRLVHQLDEHDRVMLLYFVVAGSERIRELEEDDE
jgi:hypothetical protein